MPCMALAVAGPRPMMARPNLPVAEAKPSAMATAVFSWRAETKRTPMESRVVTNKAVSSLISPKTVVMPRLLMSLASAS